MIQFFFENIDAIEINTETTVWLEKLILQEEKKLGKINYIFVTDDGLLKVNQDFLKHDYYTDIITFDYVKGKTISADIFVSLPRISENAITHSNSSWCRTRWFRSCRSRSQSWFQNITYYHEYANHRTNVL